MTGRQRNKLVPSTEEERAFPSKRDQVASSHLRSPAGQRKKASFAGSGVKIADASQLPPDQEELALYSARHRMTAMDRDRNLDGPLLIIQATTAWELERCRDPWPLWYRIRSPATVRSNFGAHLKDAKSSSQACRPDFCTSKAVNDPWW
jgi:hypothetical protein